MSAAIWPQFLNAKLLSAAVTMCIELPYCILALITAFNIAASP